MTSTPTASLPGHPESTLGPAVSIGLGTTVAMWAAAFLTHLPGMSLPPAAVGVGLLVLQGVCITLGVRSDGRVLTGLVAGLVCGLANLLVVGSLISDKAAPGLQGLRENGAAFALGSLAVGIAIGGMGGWIGSGLHARRSVVRPSHASPWLFRMSVVAAVGILPLLFIGALVTSTQSGMAVPDWPTSFSANMFLYPLKAMTGGIYYEHAHRLFGSLVGLTVLVLTLYVWLADRRGWVRFLATAVFLSVCLQGLIGGIRVTGNSTLLAMVHGIFAQLIFAATCALSATLSTSFKAAAPVAPGASPVRLRGISTALLVCTIVQLGFGAATRHFPPPDRGWHSVISHIVFALVVTTLAIVVAARGKRLRSSPPAAEPAAALLARLAGGLLHGIGLQLLLGVAALWAVLVYGKQQPPHWADVLLTTLHQLNGAVLLALCVLVFVWARRLAV
ncbi:MAG: COX15/CtaA family protein [Phycisphaerales bacterium]